MFASSSIALLISAVAVVASDHSARNHRGLASRLEQMSKRGSFSGRATWYPTDTGADACTGKNHLDSDYFIAMNVPQFDNDGCCGKQVKISYNGKSAVATCVDECASCPTQGQIDLTKGLFSYLTDGNLDLGEFTATWSYVDGSDDDSSPTTTKKTTTTKATPKATTQAAPKVTTTHTTHHTTSTPKPEPTEEVKTTSKKVEAVSSTTKHSSSAKPTSSASSVKPSSSAVHSSSATPISLSIPAASSSEASSALPSEGVANVGSGSTSSAADTSSDSSSDDSNPASGALGGVSQGASSGAASIGSNKLTAALAALALVVLRLL